MNVKDVIENALTEKDGIYFLIDHEHFNYNDGDKIENYILKVIRQATDISSDSRELEARIRDWPSLYHLSRERSLAYRSLRIPSSARILEVGCGCASVTRFLGERAESVLALEGSPRRATITRARTRDLKSVNVLCASFQDVVFREKFDIVICNGVLEYASLFVDHREAHRKMLELLSALVAPGGSLIVAIENKLGLRYFASGKEEHTNTMFDGLEGYPRKPGGPRTFGAKELEDMMKAIFPSVESLLPLPDYKLPTAVVRADLLERANCAELFANTTRHDFGSHVLPRMHERLVWHELQKNGLMKDFANSFFMIAGDRKTALLDPDWMGDIYSIRRKPEWAVRTQISADENGNIRTTKSYLKPDASRTAPTPFVHQTTETDWSNGVSIHTAVVRALCQKGGLPIEERLREPILAWWAGIRKLSPDDGLLSGAVLDHNWQNALVTGDEVQFIDGEWAWKEMIEPAWLIYRVVAKFADDEVYYAHRWNKACRRLSPYSMMKAVAKLVGAKFGIGAVVRAAARENALQEAVSGRRSPVAKTTLLAFEPIAVRQMRYIGRRFRNALRSKFRSLAGRHLLNRK